MTTEVIDVDYNNRQQGEDLIFLLDHYACDPMGGSQGLPDQVKSSLIQQLSKRDFVGSSIAYVDGSPAGLINFVEGFSTFYAKPLINIHDLVVHSDFRGQGLSRRLLEHVENKAKQLGCCKLTLEVLAENHLAIGLYQRFGFKPYQLAPDGPSAQFWQKKF